MAKSKVKPGTPHPTRKGLVMGKNGRYVAKTTYAKQLKAAAQAEKGGAIVKSKGSAIVKSEGGAIVKDKGSAIVKDKGSAIVKSKGGAITKPGSSAVVKTKPGVAALRRQAAAAAAKATTAGGLRAALGMIIKRAGPLGAGLTIADLTFNNPAVLKAYQNYDPKSLLKRGAGGGQGNKGRNKPEPPKPRQMSNIPPSEGTGGAAEKKLKYGAHAEKPAEAPKLRDQTPEQREKKKSAMRAAYEKAKAAGNYKEADRLGREIYNRTYKKTKFKSGTQGVSRRTDKEKAEYDKKKKLKAAQRSTGQRQVNRGYA